MHHTFAVSVASSPLTLAAVSTSACDGPGKMMCSEASLFLGGKDSLEFCCC